MKKNIKSLLLRLSPDLHKELKLKAVNELVTMHSLILKLLQEGLRNEK